MGCDTCHTTHKIGEEASSEFDYHLTKAVPALCIDCHDVKDAALVKAHQGNRSPRRPASVPRSAPVGAAEADAEVHCIRRLPRSPATPATRRPKTAKWS